MASTDVQAIRVKTNTVSLHILLASSPDKLPVVCRGFLCLSMLLLFSVFVFSLVSLLLKIVAAALPLL